MPPFFAQLDLLPASLGELGVRQQNAQEEPTAQTQQCSGAPVHLLIFNI